MKVMIAMLLMGLASSAGLGLDSRQAPALGEAALAPSEAPARLIPSQAPARPGERRTGAEKWQASPQKSAPAPQIAHPPTDLGAPTAALDDDGCRRCDHQGVVPCPEHKDDIHDLEGDVLFCSIVARCEACAGALLVDCERCDSGPRSAEIPARQAEVAAWLAVDPMSDFLERPVPHVETARFELVVDTGELKNGKKKMDAHRIMHLVARDVETVRAMIADHFAIVPKDYFAKHRMWIWENPDDHIAVMRKFLGSTSTGDFKLLGKDPVFSVYTEPSFSTVPGVRRLFTHNATHMLLSNAYKMQWTGDTGGGWFDAGSAHYYEYAIHELSLNYCIEEAIVPLDYHGGVWRAAIRKRLAKEELRALPRLLPLNTGAMTLPDQALCFSFYEWLVHEHPDKLAPLQKALKDKRPGRDVLEEVMGSSVLALEDAWRAWVDERYPIKGDELREPKKKKK